MAGWQDGPAGDCRARAADQLRRLLIAAWLLLLGACGSGCGYRVTVGAATVPGGGRALEVALASDRGAEAWPAARLTRELRLAAERAGLTLSDGGGEVPRLEARILELLTRPRAVSVFGGRYHAQEQEVHIRVRFILRRLGRVERRWEAESRGSYLVAPDLRGTEANRVQGASEVLDDLAVEAIDRLLDRFDGER